jgi:hypothetical protein
LPLLLQQLQLLLPPDPGGPRMGGQRIVHGTAIVGEIRC